MITVLVEPWRAHPLAWIHRAEAHAIVDELRGAGRGVSVAHFRGTAPPASPTVLLRLSDPVMRRAASVLGAARVQYRGPGSASLERCYDKWTACRLAAQSGIACPETRFATDADGMTRPVILKPRHGSDSIGLRLVRNGAVPARWKSEHTLAQAQIIGPELTVGVIDGIAGMPLRLLLPEATPYTFLRKYLLRPRREVQAHASQARETALRAAALLGVDWAARVDFIHERSSGRLMFLECDAAPLVGPQSAFAASLAAAGITRTEQLARLLGER